MSRDAGRPDDERAFAEARAALVAALAAEGVGDERTLAAMARVPRHCFVPEALRDVAYEDRALPIGGDQTISQPRMVAAMTAALAPKADESVLEIGTGSGYQTAILAELCGTVFTIERRAALAAQAAARLAALGYTNVRTRVGDGRLGWPEAAPFPAILVTAGAEALPEALWSQLAEGGRVVAPLGPARGLVLTRIDKTDGVPRTTTFGRCAFVPLLPGEVPDEEDRT
ncbi:MAG TPA: protein-L-isoaspartate(D-aspartate) O-methyltransferase [Thermodesulfobacteriota bacterium]